MHGYSVSCIEILITSCFRTICLANRLLKKCHFGEVILRIVFLFIFSFFPPLMTRSLSYSGIFLRIPRLCGLRPSKCIRILCVIQLL